MEHSSPFSRFIERVRSLRPSDDGQVSRVDRLPDGRTSLVLRVLRVLHGRQRRADLTVIGPRTHALLKEARGFAYAIELQFKPGWAAPLLGVPVNALADRFIALGEIWGHEGRELEDELAELAEDESDTEIIARIERAFTLRSRRQTALFEPTSAPLARRAVRLMEQDCQHEGARVERVADRLGVSTRHLRRAFADNIGISPKEFARSARLQRALRMVDAKKKSEQRDWVQIASNAGYYDQAHLIADFRDLIGLTPVAFTRRCAL